MREFLNHPATIAVEKMRRTVSYWINCLSGFILFCVVGSVAAEPMKTESRMPFLHTIQLHDATGKVITLPELLGENGKPQDAKGPPYSTEMTCGKCHDYTGISQGWHFNAGSTNSKPGRPGEPWIFTDTATHTQIPISYRGWKGTFKPAQMGMSDYEFLTNFARQFPGGGMGSPDAIDTKDPKMGRMQITGTLEVDCLACHLSSADYNTEGRLAMMRGENFSWSPTVAASLGTFASFRSAGQIANSWRPGRTAPTNLPAIKYNRGRFDAENNVTFHVTRRSTSESCYFCHTTQTLSEDSRWHSDNDVHLKAGMSCVDCHRHGLDHMIVRGYEGESKDRSPTDTAIGLRARMIQRDDAKITDDDARALALAQLKSEVTMIDTLSCAGCHNSGRLGSPKPIHRGLPTVHFAKLTCTACHSGPVAGPQPELIHTALAHKLGVPLAARGKDMAPKIVEPVFLWDANGKIAPFKMVWPSYWAHRKDGKLTPMLPADVAKTAELPKHSSEEQLRDPHNSEPLTDRQILDALLALSDDASKGEPVFIAAGKLYRAEKSKLLTEKNDAAAPYSWALAHDVRPARLALGAKGCSDCHSSDSPEFFGTVIAQGPVDPTNGLRRAMWEIRGDSKSKTWAEAFAYAFTFRPWLKITVLAAAAIVLLVLLHFGMRGIGAISGHLSAKKQP